MTIEEFQDIQHCGGQFTISSQKGENGRLQMRFGVSHSKPTPAGWFAVYVTREGEVVDSIQLGGIGQPWNTPPVPAVPVFIGSDRHGFFGHQCLRCDGYWRSSNAQASWPMVCPYCGLIHPPHSFLTDGQQSFIGEVLTLLHDILENEKEGDFVIDLDEIDDQVRNGGIPKPDFYHSETSQQNKFACHACKARQDILGKFGFCSCCGTRNDLQMLQKEIATIRERINEGGSYSNFVKDAISAFDTMGRNYAQILCKMIPMTPARKARLERLSFHNLEPCVEFVKAAFDIDFFTKMSDEDSRFITLMFHKRHVYEHNGGEVDEKYLKDSGDTTVKLKQAIRETQNTAHKTCDCVLKLAQNFHDGYHSIFPPISKAVASKS